MVSRHPQGNLLSLVAATALLVSCTTTSPTGGSTPAASSSPSSSTTASPLPGIGTLAVYVQRAAALSVTVVGITGQPGAGVARVVARATLALRTPLPAPMCPPSSGCGGLIDFPYVSTTRDKVFVLDGDSSLKELSLDGSLRPVRSLDGTATLRAAFAVSPDDRRIAVALIDFGVHPADPEKLFVENLAGGGRVDLSAPSPNLYYWPVGWRGGEVVLASGLASAQTLTNPYSATGYALIAPTAGSTATVMRRDDCLPTGLLSAAGTACVSGWGSQCLGDLVSHTDRNYYYSSCLRRLDWAGKETVFLLPNYSQTNTMLGGPAALSPDGRAIITNGLFLAMEPDAQGFGGNQFALGYGNAPSGADVGWIGGSHVTWTYQCPDGSSAERIMELGSDYASATNVTFEGYPVVAGAPQSPVMGRLAATLPESL